MMMMEGHLKHEVEFEVMCVNDSNATIPSSAGALDMKASLTPLIICCHSLGLCNLMKT